MILILGGGLTGLTVAYELEKKKIDYLVIEKEDELGGLCRSQKEKGFIFDYTGHFFHFSSKQKKFQRFVFELLNNKFLKIHRNSKIYTKYSQKDNKLLPYPFQANIKFLHSDIRKECLKELLRSNLQHKSAKNFKEFVVNNFGFAIYKYFFEPYNYKLWKEKLENLDISWAKNFVPLPNTEEIFNNVVEEKIKDYGYNVYFYYPKDGGIQEFIDAIVAKLNKSKIITSAEVVKIDYRTKTVNFISKNGLEKITYDKLITTIPLLEFIRISNFPKNMKNMTENFRYRSVLCFNIALKKPVLKGVHWIYFPDKEQIFYRIGFYHNISSKLVPYNCGSLYVEVSLKEDDKFSVESIFNRVVKDLINTKIISQPSEILFYKPLIIKYGYVVYNFERVKLLPKVLQFLEKNNIYSIGRYGAWKYSYMTENINDAIETVKKIFK